jgi:tetratricopeptide (TPR) repeat protein
VITRFLPLVLAVALAQQERVEISASLNRPTARVGETVLLTVTIRAPGTYSPEIEDPGFSGLEVVSQSDRSTFRYSPSAGSVREFTRVYTLAVNSAGDFAIAPVRIVVDGVEYETEAISLTVEGGGPLDIPGGLRPRSEEEVAVRLWVEPETAYVGQQVTMTVGAFFDPLVRGRLQRQPEYRPPEVQGFWTAELPGSPRPERQVIGQREYFVQIYKRALFPLSPGTIRIPPAAVIYEVRRGLIYAPETFQVESAPTAVTVLPLPAGGVPPDFAGAVGQYDTEVWYDRSDLRAGEAVNLVLEVIGSGNLSSLARPEFPPIVGLRVYEGGEDAEVQLRGDEFAGHKRFSWVLVPERSGDYVLPALRLPHFDPRQAAYVVATTEPVTLSVGGSSPAAMGAGGSGSAAVRFVKARPGRQALGLASRREYWAIQIVPLALLLGSLAFGRIRRRAPSVGRQKPQRRQQALRALRPAAESGDVAFFGQLRTTVLAWLEVRLRRPGLSSQGIVKVQHSLEDAGVPPQVALDVLDLVERCGRLRYSPEPPGSATAKQMLAEADRLLALVDNEAISPKSLRATPGSAAGGPLLIALALAGLWPGPASAQEGATDRGEWLFHRGVADYGRGDYAQAAGLFEAARAERPGDPNVYYNLANAYYELDERGKAVAFWIRALRLKPRDGDARFNLRLVVGDDPVIGSALPLVPVSPDELALLFGLFWFATCAAFLARRRWRKTYLAFAGGAAFALALLCAVLISLPSPQYAVAIGSEAALRKGPVGQSEVIANPAPGTGFRVQERRGEWVRVSRGSESEGWIELTSVELID